MISDRTDPVTTARDFAVRARRVPAPAIRGITMARLWAIVLLLLFTAFILRSQIGFVDLGFHLRAGEATLSAGHWLDHDTFTSTFFGAPWLNQNWLAQVALFETWNLAGLHGLVVLNTLLFAAGFAILFWLCARRGRGVRVGAIAVVAAVLPAIYNTAVRPQSFSWFLLALVLLILETSEGRPRLLWLLPPLFAVWANVHGAFAVGLAFLGIEALAAIVAARRGGADRTWARLLLGVTGLSAVAALINPWGWNVYGYVLDIGTDPTIRGAIEEWQPPSIADSAGLLFFVSVAVVVAVLAMSRARPSLGDALRLLIGGVLGLLAIRNGLWWAFAAGPALASLLAPWSERLEREGDEPRPLNVAILAVVAVIAVLASPWLRSVSPLVSEKDRSLIKTGTPVQAARFLQTHSFEGNMLNTQGLGSFLEFVAPQHRTFLDSRIEMFPPGLWSDYTHLMSADPGFEELLERRNIGYAVLATRPRPPLADALERSDDWNEAYSDAEVAIYVKKATQRDG